MDDQSKSIAKFQRNKEESIAIMSANRDATMIVCEILKFRQSKIGPDWNDDEIKKEIKEWRKWFYYNIYSLDPDDEAKQEAKMAPGSVPF